MRLGPRHAPLEAKPLAQSLCQFDAVDEARALNVAAFKSLRGFGHYDGTSFHRMRTKSRLPSRSVTTSTGSVGQIL